MRRDLKTRLDALFSCYLHILLNTRAMPLNLSPPWAGVKRRSASPKVRTASPAAIAQQASPRRTEDSRRHSGSRSPDRKRRRSQSRDARPPLDAPAEPSDLRATLRARRAARNGSPAPNPPGPAANGRVSGRLSGADGRDGNGGRDAHDRRDDARRAHGDGRGSRGERVGRNSRRASSAGGGGGMRSDEVAGGHRDERRRRRGTPSPVPVDEVPSADADDRWGE